MPMTLSGDGTITGLAAGGLPDATVTASDLASGAARSNFGAGAVLQVVNATYSTQVSSSSSTYADTGLTATITPSSTSSKILIIVDQADVYKATNDTSCRIQLQRNGTLITQFSLYSSGTGTSATNVNGSVGTNYLDSPATTSAVTYKTRFASTGNNASVAVQFGNSTSTITLMEIAG
jgi:hypothetical protein